VSDKNGNGKSNFSDWRKANRLTLQTASLAAALLAPFALFFSLSAGWAALSVILFGVIMISMLLAWWAG
jgi:hypothetical protein